MIEQTFATTSQLSVLADRLTNVETMVGGLATLSPTRTEVATLRAQLDAARAEIRRLGGTFPPPAA